ncbi:MAG: amino acid permease [Acidobacteriota bacterium]|nr:amino acid permease [Acidobacteriota bacterium]
MEQSTFSAAAGAQADFNSAATGNRLENRAEPKAVLGLTDAIALIVGIVVGAGIFSFPSLVAANAGSETAFLAAWALGGLVSLVGALCYAELASTFPSAGGDYHFLTRAYGKRLSFLFAWARMSVIQTGSVALLAFVFGDFASQVFPLGEYSSAIYAALIVILLTAINIAGIGFGTGAQKLFTTLEVLAIAAVIFAGIMSSSDGASNAVSTQTASAGTASFGMTMVFVLLTYGGWNEAAYLSGEMRGSRKQIAWALVAGILIVTALYLLVNVAYLSALGLDGLANSKAAASDAVRSSFGDWGAIFIGVAAAICALTSANATIFTGARTNYALGRDFSVLKPLGKWNAQTDAPINAFLVQGVIALLLIGLGILTRKGIQTMVDYTAPVFWVFFLLTGISLFVLRRKEPNVERPFRVPLYPLTPLVFCLTSLYLLYSSLAYTGAGALVGVAVLAVGAVLLALVSRKNEFLNANQTQEGKD